MNNFFQELKRRNVFKVGVAYAVVGWVILQFVDVVQDPLSLPDWFQRITIVALAIGFPIALVISWAFEVTTEGVKKTEEVDKDKSITPSTGKRINKLIIGGLALAVIFLLVDKFMLTPSQDIFIEEAEAGQVAIAVLPFVNMSSDPEQEFFSDGMTEEILNVLAKNRSLKVAGRTSSFAYKGENQDLRAIGEALGVQYLVEGSVRKSGETVRITAQVIKADDGFHIWSETYDRQLTDIFAVQDEIAKSVSDALQVSFGLGEGESLVTNTTDNMAAYDLYLKAKDAHKKRRIQEAIDLSKQVTAMEPDFAPAWAVYAQAEALAPLYIHNFELIETAAALGRAEIAAQKALTLDPNSVDALGALANVLRARRHWADAEEVYLRALELDPDSPVILEDYGQFLIAVGKLGKAREFAEKMVSLEPRTPVYLNGLVNIYVGQEEYEPALLLTKQIIEIDPDLEFYSANYGALLAVSGRFEEARAYLENTPVITQATRDYYNIYINFLENGEAGLSETQEAVVANDPLFLAMLGRKDELFTWLSENVELGWWGDYFTFFPDMKKFWGTPEFKAHLYELELPAYWRDHGWPDMCRPIVNGSGGADDFECNQ